VCAEILILRAVRSLLVGVARMSLPSTGDLLALLQVNSQDHLMQRKCGAGGIIHVLSRALKLVCKNCRIILQSDINTSLRERSVESSISKISVP
jgi:hypothetical protein